MSDHEHASLPVRILLRFLLTIALVWGLATFATDSVTIEGGWAAIVTIAALVTLLNMLARPLLVLLTLPFRLFAVFLATIIVNGVFVWLIILFTQLMDSQYIGFEINDIAGWIIVAVVLGVGNWGMKMILK